MLRKVKSVVDQEKEEWLKQYMVETIQQIQKTRTQIEGPSTSMEGWNTIWLGMPNIIPLDAQKYQETINSQGKLIIGKRHFSGYW